MTSLIKYEAARAALAECRTIDEAKDIIDKAEAIRAYGRMADDVQLEIDATEIRLRAERKLGALIGQEKEAGRLTVGRPKKNGSSSEPLSPTLESLGIDKKLSSRSQKVAGIAERAFEAMIARKRAEMAKRGVRVSLDLLHDGDKAERRATRERVLGGIQLALPKKKFGVILADPEWRFEPWSRSTGMDRSPDNHYPTSVTEVIAARPVTDIAADDCVLFLWATAPMLPHALSVMAAWDFDYKSHQIWRKDRIGTGYWFRNVHELLLVGTRGNIPAPAPGDNELSVIDAPRGAHSAKPECFHEMIERWYPTLPKIELNRRGPARPGWEAWGNEADAPVDGEGNAIVGDPETGEVVAPESQPPVTDEARDIRKSIPDGEHPLDVPAFLRRQKEDAA